MISKLGLCNSNLETIIDLIYKLSSLYSINENEKFFFETANFIKQPNPCSRRTETGETENTNKRRRI